jgi:hypothetical protein
MDPSKTLWLSPLVIEDGFGVQFRDDHVHIELTKDFKVDPSKRDAFWAVISDACKRHETRRVLVEGFIPEGERETSDVVDAGQKTAVVPRLWLAFAIPGFHPTDQTELYVAIAASKGVRVKFFDDSKRALSWLRNNSAS